MRNPFLIIRFIFFCESRSIITYNIPKLMVFASVDDLHDHFDHRFCIMERRRNNIVGTAWCVLISASLVHQINPGLFGSARGVSIFDFEWRRTLCFHRCVRLGSTLTDGILIKMDS